MFPALPLLMANFFRKNALKIAGVVGILLLIGFAYFQYKSNIKLQAQNLNLQATVFETRARMDTVIEQADHISKINADMIEKERALSDALFGLTNKFAKDGRDFRNLVRQKPGLVEPIINNATRETLRCVEATSRGQPCAE